MAADGGTQLSGPVEGLTGTLCAGASVFQGRGGSGGGLGGNVGQNSSLTSISCRWGAQGSRGGAEGRAPC